MKGFCGTLAEWLLIFIVLGVVALIIGLGIAKSTHKQTADEVPVARELERGEQMEYIVFDGHEYLKYRSGYGDCSVGGITHSPKCPCGNASKVHL